MATLSGNGGAVTLPTGFVGKVFRWSMESNYHEADDTGFDDNGNYSAVATLVERRGVVSCYVTDGNGNDPEPDALFGTLAEDAFDSCEGTLTLTAKTGKTYSGTALITSVPQDRAVKDEPMMVTFNYVFKGAVTKTWP